ncbi:DUF2252 family protein [Streptomyces exfoliatus]|nr:DUF2252 family protein [Streptomyces exfoliatus]
MRRRARAELRAFASPERHLLFDVTDFDETLPGPPGRGTSSGLRPARS